MKPYGVDKRDRGCCPGHDKFPHEPRARVRGGCRAKLTRIAHKRARARNRIIEED